MSVDSINRTLLGERISNLRKASKSSQNAVALNIGMDPNYYRKIECGSASVSLHKLIDISNYFNSQFSPLINDNLYSYHLSKNICYELYKLTSKNRIKVIDAIILANGDSSLYFFLSNTKANENKTIGHRVRSLKSLFSLTNKDLARILHVEPQTITNKFDGNNGCSIDELYTLSKTYNVPVDYFLVDILNNNMLGLEFILSTLDITKNITHDSISIINKYLELFTNNSS